MSNGGRGLVNQGRNSHSSSLNKPYCSLSFLLIDSPLEMSIYIFDHNILICYLQCISIGHFSMGRQFQKGSFFREHDHCSRFALFVCSHTGRVGCRKRWKTTARELLSWAAVSRAGCFQLIFSAKVSPICR